MSALPPRVEPIPVEVSREFHDARLKWPPLARVDAWRGTVTESLLHVRHWAPEGRDTLARCLREGIRRAKAAGGNR